MSFTFKASRRAAVGVFAALTAFSLAACSSSTPPAETGGSTEPAETEVEELSLRVGTMYGPDNWQTVAMEAFTDAVTEESGGAITFEYFYADALLAQGELAGGLKDGVIDLSTFVPVYTPAEFPIDQWAGGLTYGYDRAAAGVLQGLAATAEWGFENESYRAELEAAGLTPLIPRLLMHPEFGVLCTPEAATLDQISGLRARVGSATAGAEAEGLGAVPTNVAGAEVYSAFQQGVIDCSWTNLPDMQGLGLTEIAHNYLFAPLNGWSHASVAFSSSTWATLSEAQKDAIWAAVPAYFEAFAAGSITQNIAGVSVDGMNYHEPDAELLAALESIHSDIVADLPSTAPATLSDAAAAIDLAASTKADWSQKVADLGFDTQATSWVDYADRNGSDVPDLSAWVDAVAEMLNGKRPA